eukprot:scaffold173853_cov26-Prasinocladus_malaysianus.AAC.2
MRIHSLLHRMQSTHCVQQPHNLMASINGHWFEASELTHMHARMQGSTWSFVPEAVFADMLTMLKPDEIRYVSYAYG